jgi:SAM-dependent methyltransferase
MISPAGREVRAAVELSTSNRPHWKVASGSRSFVGSFCTSASIFTRSLHSIGVPGAALRGSTTTGPSNSRLVQSDAGMSGPIEAGHVLEGLVCLKCDGETLEKQPAALRCEQCGSVYPVVNGIPVAVIDGLGLFSQSDFMSRQNFFFDLSRSGRLAWRLARILPRFNSPRISRQNYRALANALAERSGKARVLVVGGSVLGQGMEPLLENEQLQLVESDVSFGERTNIILDAHHIPYADSTFDAVIAQAVLEHVLDPIRCVAEFHRVLKPDGMVYAETPFMQQVHGGPYDFTRFTLSGHRRLFRNFRELRSGATAGPGTVMAWSYEYLLLSLVGYNHFLRMGVKVVTRVTGFWLRFLDRLVERNQVSLGAASAYYFWGVKSGEVVTDQEIIDYYTGP